MSTSDASTVYAILGQRKLKSASDIVHARRHNNREEAVGNADPNAPAPEVIFGPADSWVGVRDRLEELDIKPREGAVLALELMMTTSPEWWSKDENARAIQMMAVERCAWAYLRNRFTKEAIVSLTWHSDETTPHLHVIVVPVRKRVDGRFRDGRERWTLCARGDLHDTNYETAWRGGLGGRGHMAHEQTKFAEALAPLKLARGKHWSGAPNRPNGVYQAEMREEIAAARRERESLGREREAVAQEAERQRDDALELDRRRTELDAERAAWDAAVQAREDTLRADRERFDADRRELDDARAKAVKWKADVRAKGSAMDAHEEALLRRERRAAARLDEAVKRGDALADMTTTVVKALATIDTRGLPEAQRRAVFAVADALGVAIKRTGTVDPAFGAMARSRTLWSPPGQAA